MVVVTILIWLPLARGESNGSAAKDVKVSEAIFLGGWPQQGAATIPRSNRFPEFHKSASFPYCGLLQDYGTSFRSVCELREAIDAFIKAYNQTAASFEWTNVKVYPKALPASSYEQRYANMKLECKSQPVVKEFWEFSFPEKRQHSPPFICISRREWLPGK